eukprot:scaffold300343_cov28-Tisochrysis_lutea.AAC.1
MGWQCDETLCCLPPVSGRGFTKSSRHGSRPRRACAPTSEEGLKERECANTTGAKSPSTSPDPVPTVVEEATTADMTAATVDMIVTADMNATADTIAIMIATVIAIAGMTAIA